ncbi:transaldolase [Ectothiorhodospira haloalkaliphila]|uniref:transaldolase n=1 Tax=Ectothiorhodospira haloalkaliphila TaxID=421628 RepID=UPI001EE79A93|nr:transaldolase [Ectothiorhodospira haloalkaliphila]MCG5525760.1 transaldolase [Ectothiorhodospira haloalkaliphila]
MGEHNPLLRLRELGQSIWYDYIRKDLMESGELARLIREDGLGGLTSNPAIFDKAITGSDLYDDGIRQALTAKPDISTPALFYRLAIEDLQAAADAFRDTHDQTNGQDGFVSLEVSPDLAFDTEGTVREALDLAAQVDRPNLMIKVPGTLPGLGAIEQLTAQGINVNVTLLFAVSRYEAVLEAYIKGLEARLEQGLPVDRMASVASFFVSRVDSALDDMLDERIREGRPVEHMQGRLAIANAKLAYGHFLQVTQSERWQRLKSAGARPQRLLWASTGTKNPAYSDVLYVESLIGADTVNTLPPATYDAFRDHGKAALTLEKDLEQSRALIQGLPDLGIDLESVTDRLEGEGIEAFAKAFDHLLQGLEDKRARLAA